MIRVSASGIFPRKLGRGRFSVGLLHPYWKKAKVDSGIAFGKKGRPLSSCKLAGLLFSRGREQLSRQQEIMGKEGMGQGALPLGH